MSKKALVSTQKTKPGYSTTVATSSLLDDIERDASRAWAKHDAIQEPLQTAFKALEKEVDAFARAFLVQDVGVVEEHVWG